MAIEPTLLGGPRNAWGPPHHTFGRVQLEPGHVAYLEYSGCRRRYHAPVMRSVCLGEPSRDARTLADACLATVQSLLDAIRPGRTGHDVARDAKRHIAGLGHDTYFHGAYGYAVGLGFPPTWVEAPVYLAEGSERTLEPTMTFHLPIWLWKPGTWRWASAKPCW